MGSSGPDGFQSEVVPAGEELNKINRLRLLNQIQTNWRLRLLAGAVTSDLCDITLLSPMTHQVLHGREELFRKVRQSAEGRADLRLSV